MLTRRKFICRSTAMAAAAILPIPKAMALTAPASSPPLRWFAVGNDEMSYPFLAKSAEHARRMYAWEYCARVEDECPECGEFACHEHNDDLDAPLEWVEVSHEFSGEFNVGNKPKMADWVRAGFDVPCEECEFLDAVECVVYGGRALCCECYDIARIAKLEEATGEAAI